MSGHTVNPDRLIERRRLNKAGRPLTADGRPWLGTSAGFQFDKKFVDLIPLFAGNEAPQALQALSWGNLPILNEWRRRWPDRDPVKLHEEFWHTRLVYPGGGGYVWNAEWTAIRTTGSRILERATLYSTAEPCILCGFAIRETQIMRVVMGRPAGDIGSARSKSPVLAADWVARRGRPPSVVWWH